MSKTTPYVSIPDSEYAPSIPAKRLENAYNSLITLLREPLPSKTSPVSIIQSRYYALRAAYYSYLNLVAHNSRDRWAKEGMCLDPNPTHVPKDLEGLRKFRDEVKKQMKALAVFDELRVEAEGMMEEKEKALTKEREARELEKDEDGPGGEQEDEEDDGGDPEIEEGDGGDPEDVEDDESDQEDETNSDEGGVQLEDEKDHDESNVESENGSDQDERVDDHHSDSDEGADDHGCGSDKGGQSEDERYYLEGNDSESSGRATVVPIRILPRPKETGNDKGEAGGVV